MLPYQKLISEAEALENQAKAKREEADRLRRQCHHVWGPTKDTSIYHKAYTCPGDPPGTMGVDWRGPVHVPAETIPQWSRTCTTCGFTQSTQRKKLVGGTLQHEEPDFGDDRRSW